jgi:hypothetical protein
MLAMAQINDIFGNDTFTGPPQCMCMEQCHVPVLQLSAGPGLDSPPT